MTENVTPPSFESTQSQLNSSAYVLEKLGKVSYVGSIDRRAHHTYAPVVDRLHEDWVITVNGSDVTIHIPSNGSPEEEKLSREVSRKNAVVSLFWPHIQQHVSEIRMSDAKDLSGSEKLKQSQIFDRSIHLAAGTCPEKVDAIEMYVRALGYDVRCVEDCRRFFKRTVVAHADEQSALVSPWSTAPPSDQTDIAWQWSCFLAEKLHKRCRDVCCKACYSDKCLSPPYDAIQDALMRPLEKPLSAYYKSVQQYDRLEAEYFVGEKEYAKSHKRTVYGDSSEKRETSTWSTVFDIFFDSAKTTPEFDPTLREDEEKPSSPTTTEEVKAGHVIKHKDILDQIVSNLLYLERKSGDKAGFFTKNQNHVFGKTELGVLKIAIDAWCWGFHAPARQATSSSDSKPSAAVLYDKNPVVGLNKQRFEKHFGLMTCFNATQLGILAKISRFKFVRELYECGAGSKKAQKLLSHPSHLIRYFSALAIKTTYECTGVILCKRLNIDQSELKTSIEGRWKDVCKVLKKTCQSKQALLIDLVSHPDSSWYSYAKNGRYDVEMLLKWLSKSCNLVADENLVGSLLIAMESH